MTKIKHTKRLEYAQSIIIDQPIDQPESQDRIYCTPTNFCLHISLIKGKSVFQIHGQSVSFTALLCFSSSPSASLFTFIRTPTVYHSPKATMCRCFHVIITYFYKFLYRKLTYYACYHQMVPKKVIFPSRDTNLKVQQLKSHSDVYGKTMAKLKRNSNITDQLKKA